MRRVKLMSVHDPRGGRLAKADFELLAEFRFALRRFLRFSEEAAAEQGLTPQQYQALLAIEGFPKQRAVSVRDLAEQLLIVHQSAVGLVNRLETLGLVKRSSCPDDRRCVRISLTEKGLVALDRLYRIHRAELSSIGPDLSELLRKASRQMPLDLARSEGGADSDEGN